jgi:hypothetical protein
MFIAFILHWTRYCLVTRHADTVFATSAAFVPSTCLTATSHALSIVSLSRVKLRSVEQHLLNWKTQFIFVIIKVIGYKPGLDDNILFIRKTFVYLTLCSVEFVFVPHREHIWTALKNQCVDTVKASNRCLFWESYKHIMQHFAKSNVKNHACVINMFQRMRLSFFLLSYFFLLSSNFSSVEYGISNFVRFAVFQSLPFAHTFTKLEDL